MTIITKIAGGGRVGRPGALCPHTLCNYKTALSELPVQTRAVCRDQDGCWGGEGQPGGGCGIQSVAGHRLFLPWDSEVCRWESPAGLSWHSTAPTDDQVGGVPFLEWTCLQEVLH